MATEQTAAQRDVQTLDNALKAAKARGIAYWVACRSLALATHELKRGREGMAQQHAAQGMTLARSLSL